MCEWLCWSVHPSRSTLCLYPSLANLDPCICVVWLQGMLLADTASSCCGDTHSEAGDSVKGRPTFGQRRWVVEVGFLCPHSDAHIAADDAFALSSIMPAPSAAVSKVDTTSEALRFLLLSSSNHTHALVPLWFVHVIGGRGHGGAVHPAAQWPRHHHHGPHRQRQHAMEQGAELLSPVLRSCCPEEDLTRILYVMYYLKLPATRKGLFAFF